MESERAGNRLPSVLSERRAIDRESASHAPPPNASPRQLPLSTIDCSATSPIFYFGGGGVVGAWGLMEHDGVSNLNAEPPGGAQIITSCSHWQTAAIASANNLGLY